MAMDGHALGRAWRRAMPQAWTADVLDVDAIRVSDAQWNVLDLLTPHNATNDRGGYELARCQEFLSGLGIADEAVTLALLLFGDTPPALMETESRAFRAWAIERGWRCALCDPEPCSAFAL